MCEIGKGKSKQAENSNPPQRLETSIRDQTQKTGGGVYQVLTFTKKQGVQAADECDMSPYQIPQPPKKGK